MIKKNYSGAMGIVKGIGNHLALGKGEVEGKGHHFALEKGEVEGMEVIVRRRPIGCLE